MSDSTPVIADLLLTANAAGQAAKANDLFNSTSPAALYARNPATTTGLTWGYIGGRFLTDSDGSESIANGTLSLTGSNTNYIVAARADGAVSASTSNTNWGGDDDDPPHADYIRLYKVVTGASSITSYGDYRSAFSGGSGGGGSFTGGTLTSASNEAPTATIASASTVNIGAASANSISITGTTTITAFDTIAAGARRLVVFDGILTLTHNGTSLILPTSANITTAAGDTAEFLSLGSGNWRCVDYMRASGSSLAGGGGLTNWTDGLDSSSPNASKPVASLTATNAATNVDAAIIPKGNGAIIAAVPNSGTSGGNKRGNNAVDLQTAIRGAASQVASGTNSVIGGGTGNTASGANSTISGGTQGEATGTASTVGGGNNNTASNTSSTVGGGINNIASGDASTVPGGSSNTASGTGATAFGAANTASGNYSSAIGRHAHTRGVHGRFSRASGAIGGAAGEGQFSELVLRIQTTNNSATDLTSDHGAASAINQMVLQNNSAMLCKVRGVARNSADRAAYEVNVLIYRGANAASTTIEGSPTVSTLYASAGAASWVFAVSADTTNGALKVTVTGATSTTINWVAVVESVEVVR